MNTRKMPHRTTWFRLDDDLLGEVHVVDLPRATASRWHALLDRDSRRTSGRFLPTASLQHALTVLSGDLVRIGKTKELSGDGTAQAWVVSRKPMLPFLEQALLAWTLAVFEETIEVDELLGGLQSRQVRVADAVADGGAEFQASWAWDAGKWEVAHRLASQPMLLGEGEGTLDWTLTSAGNLMAPGRMFERPSKSTKDTQPWRGLMGLDLSVCNRPRRAGMFVSLDAKIIRLAQWASHSDRSVFVPDDHMILALQLSKRRARRYEDRSAEVLKQLRPLPELDTRPGARTDLWVVPAHAPPAHRIGPGVGQRFHDQVAVHAVSVLGPKGMMTLDFVDRLAAGTKPSKSGGAAWTAAWRRAVPERPPRILLLTISPDETERMRAAASSLFDETEPCLEIIAVDSLAAAPLFTEGGTHSELAACFDQQIAPLITEHQPDAVVVPTLTDDALQDLSRSDGQVDPKPRIRRWLAEHGIPSQFYRPSPESGAGHRGKATWLDLARTLGARATEVSAPGNVRAAWSSRFGEGRPIWLVGAFIVKPEVGGLKGRFVLTMCAQQLHVTTPELVWPVGGTQWTSWRDAVPRSHTAASKRACPSSSSEVRTQLRAALLDLLARHPGAHFIVAIDGQGGRRRDLGLSNSSEYATPLADERIAWVRTDALVGVTPRFANVGALTPSESACSSDLDHIGVWYRLLGLHDDTGDDLAYFLSCPPVPAGKGNRGQLRQSRFTPKHPAEVGDPLQAFTLTEIWVAEQGSFTPTELTRTIASSMRQGPTWDGVLKRPSAVHLARSLWRDHPERQERL